MRARNQLFLVISFLLWGMGLLPAQSSAFSELRAKAESGDPKSQVELGVAYASGNSVPVSDAEAVKWFRKAAEQGNADGEYSLGEMYATGRGVEKDYKQASKWTQKAADQGDVRALTNLGAMYFNGLGVKQDERKAFQLTRQAAEQGFAAAEFGLGMMYSKGHGVQRDSGEAVKWYTKAADLGDAPAMNNLSWLLATGVNRQDRDPRKALELALRATRTTQEHLPQYLDTLANAYYVNGQYGEALSAEQKALTLKPEDKSYQQLFENYQEIAKVVTNLPASLSPDDPVHAEPGLTPPKPIFTPDPEPSAERWFGTVVVNTVVGSDGRVREPRVVRSVSPDVDEKALDAIRKWVFRPARKDGRPVALELKVEVAFPFK